MVTRRSALSFVLPILQAVCALLHNVLMHSEASAASSTSINSLGTCTITNDTQVVWSSFTMEFIYDRLNGSRLSSGSLVQMHMATFADSGLPPLQRNLPVAVGLRQKVVITTSELFVLCFVFPIICMGLQRVSPCVSPSSFLAVTCIHDYSLRARACGWACR